MLRKIAPMAMPGFLCPNLSIKCSLLFVLLGCFSAEAHMPLTSPPLTFVYDSESFEAGDIIEIEFYYGTEPNQVPSGTVFHMVHPYSGYDIEPGSTITADLTGSWIGSSHTCTDSIWVDHDNRELHVWITSTEPVSGHGLAVTVGGIEIEIVDINLRQTNPQIAVERLTVFPNPGNGLFQVQVDTENKLIHQIEICRLDGGVVHAQELNTSRSKVDARHLPMGVYLMRVYVGRELMHRKLIIRE